MNREYSILFQKEGKENIAKDLQDDFGFVVEGFKEGDIECKTIEANNWSDEDGEDAFIPSITRLSSMEIEANIVYAGQPDSSSRKINDLLYYLTNGLGEEGLCLYSKFINRGYAKCVVKEVKNKSVHRISTEEVFQCTITFKCYAPTTLKTAISTDGNLTYKIINAQ